MSKVKVAVRLRPMNKRGKMYVFTYRKEGEGERRDWIMP